MEQKLKLKFKKKCTQCKTFLPVECFKEKKCEGRKPILRSRCTECEKDSERLKNQIPLKERYENDDASIDICPSCGFYYSRFASGISKGILRDACKPCMGIKKLETNRVFQEAKRLLEAYAGEEFAVKQFINKYTMAKKA